MLGEVNDSLGGVEGEGEVSVLVGDDDDWVRERHSVLLVHQLGEQGESFQGNTSILWWLAGD